MALLEVENGGNQNQTHAVVVAGEKWHRGVIGLAASKITEKLNRPSIVISLEDGIGHGSARSIGNYHLLNGLESCGDLMEQFGGHAAAAGLKIKAENINDLREKLNQHAMQNLSDEDFIPELKVDAVVTTNSLNLNLLEDLKLLEPFGAGNQKPVFVTKDLYLVDAPFVMKEKHLKLRLSDANRKQFEAVWWDGVEKSKGQTLKPQTRIELAYTPEANTWQGNTRLQLVVEDLRSDN
jgi:single-stranded-DNA-specific exonuclease